MTGIADDVLRAMVGYGKLGLLIEDAPDAELRTAREIYGADGLPRWWLRFEDIESGSEALRAAVDAVTGREPDWARDMPLVVVVDRYLKSNRDSTRAVAWDNENEEAGRLMQALLAELRARGPSRSLCVAAVTSYFNPREDGEGIAWQSRHHEPLFQLRRSMGEDLLCFGPSERAPAGRLPATDEDDCRRRFWHETLDELAAVFGQTDGECARILFTGAGASLCNHPLGSGIPPTWFLLDWASWHLSRAAGERVEQPTWPRSAEASDDKVPVSTVKELMDRFAAGGSAAHCEWSLEDLFDIRQDNPKWRVEEFVVAFRQALQRYDHEFPFHAWLLAQLPWTLVATTNFDGIHERAAAASFPAAEAVDRVRRLGDILDLAGSPATIDDLVKGAGLFKPYGSIARIGPLALTDRDFWDRIQLVEQALEMILAGTRECWLVFLGHRLASPELTSRVDRLLKKYSALPVHLVWVDPGCCEIRRHPNRNAFLVKCFEAAAGGRSLMPGHSFYPLPARALDFAYDLWGRWARRRR